MVTPDRAAETRKAASESTSQTVKVTFKSQTLDKTVLTRLAEMSNAVKKSADPDVMLVGTVPRSS